MSTSMMGCWRTKFTKTFPTRLPLMGAPMAGVSGGGLAAETCRAGALGFIAAGYLESLDPVVEQIQIFRNLTESSACPLALGFITHTALKGAKEGCDVGDGNEGSEGNDNEEELACWDRFETLMAEHRPDVVQFFAPSVVTRRSDGKTNVEIVKEYSKDCLVMAQVGSVGEAKQALAGGVDALIAQGSEAGGHGLRRERGNATLPLAARLVSLVAEFSAEAGAKTDAESSIPVLAAGGIVDGRGVAAALALGCDGAVLGTRLWASHDAMGHSSYKAELVNAIGPDDVIRTTVADHIMNSYNTAVWPEPYDSIGMLRNLTTAEWDGRPAVELAGAIREGDLAARYRKAHVEGDPTVAHVHAGQGVGDIHSVESAYDIIQAIDDETRATLRNMQNLLGPPGNIGEGGHLGDR